MQNLDVGKHGEDLACVFLAKQGYKIIERNFQKKHGDIDIVALDGDTLVFIEAKTRRSKAYGPPLEAIPPWRVKTLIKSAEYYKLLHPKLPNRLRIDAIGIDYSDGTPKIELVKNITL